jgi:hypothetical protein
MLKQFKKIIAGWFATGLTIILSISVAGCLGGAGTSASTTPSAADVAAITATQIALYSDQQIAALGNNISQLSNAALGALTYTTLAADPQHSTGQIESISAAQIAALSPAQVRYIGSTGAGGATTTSLIQYLNTGAWAALVANQAQVAAITAAEIPTLWDSEIVAIGANFNYLSNAALGALTYTSLAATQNHGAGQIESITATEIAKLTPAQVRLLGSTGVGGATTTSTIVYLNSGTWSTLVSDPAQVAAITPAEIATLTINASEKTTSIGTNIGHLSDAALGSLTGNTSGVSNGGQIQALSAAQITALTPAQIGIIAAINVPAGGSTVSGISLLNTGAFGSLNASQIAILTTSEKASLSAGQHTSCGC